MKKCTKCLVLKPIKAYRVCRLYKGMSQGEYYRSECRECEKKVSKQLRQAKISASKKPKNCECCGKEYEYLILDHDHITGNFRGWICRNCNQGIGKLGDNLEGVNKAIKYLQSSHSSTG